MKQGLLKTTALGVSLFALAACAGSRFDDHERQMEPEGFADARSAFVEPITVLDADQAFAVSPANTGLETLPDAAIGPLTLMNADAIGILETMATRHGYVVQYTPSVGETPEESASDANEMPRATLSIRGDIDFRTAVERIARAADLFVTVEDQSIVLTDERRFLVKLPALDNLLGEIAGTLDSLGADNIVSDNTTATVAFTATRDIYEDVATYFENLTEHSALIVFDMWIYEVTLEDDISTGINWQDFSWSTFINDVPVDFTGAGNFAVDSAFSLGVISAPPRTAIDAVFTFLQDQGDVETLSQPTVQFLSGGAANLTVGRETQYIAEVTQTTDSNGAVSSAISTESLNTGLTLDISGRRSGRAVFTDIELSLDSLISFQDFSTNSTQLSLPEISERQITTSTRANAGDMIILAGLVEDRRAYNQRGLPGLNAVPGFGAQTQEARNSELVVMMRPRLVTFEPVDVTAQTGTMTLPADVPVAPTPEPEDAARTTEPEDATEETVLDEAAAPAPVQPIAEPAPIPAPEMQEIPMEMPKSTDETSSVAPEPMTVSEPLPAIEVDPTAIPAPERPLPNLVTPAAPPMEEIPMIRANQQPPAPAPIDRATGDAGPTADPFAPAPRRNNGFALDTRPLFPER